MCVCACGCLQVHVCAYYCQCVRACAGLCTCAWTIVSWPTQVCLESEGQRGRHSSTEPDHTVSKHCTMRRRTCCEFGGLLLAILKLRSVLWRQVFYGIPFKPGDRILTSVIEYGANYIAFLQVPVHAHCLLRSGLREPLPLCLMPRHFEWVPDCFNALPV